ncbi:MAG TPA: aldo/keto reductase [Terriglobia bacterium]|nr:aldo/keto reductase [Terriglobia bacterium]
MEYRALAHTDLKVSRLSFGTMPFGSQADQATATRMVNQCLDAGINFFDTANMYNLGKAETMLGAVLGGTRWRKDVIIATKVRYKMGDEPDDVGLSRAAILKAIDASLKRLGTDYIDLYYLHWPDYSTPIEETLDAMEELVRAGKVRYTGVSNYAAWQVAEIHWISHENGYKPPYVSQPMYNLLARGIEEEYLPFCKRFDVAVVAYNPLAGGLLTGKHTRKSKPEPGSRFDNNPTYLGRYWHDDYFAALDQLQIIARDAGKTLIELSLQWLLSQPMVDSVILGASRLEQLEENLKACDARPLDEATLDRCDAVWKRLCGITPKYNR